jgi:hypothetical protein
MFLRTSTIAACWMLKLVPVPFGMGKREQTRRRAEYGWSFQSKMPLHSG